MMFRILSAALLCLIHFGAVHGQDEDLEFRPMFNGKNLDDGVNVNCAPST